MKQRRVQIQRTSIAMLIAGLFAASSMSISAAENTVQPAFGYSWDGTKVLVNQNIQGASNESVRMNEDGSVTFDIHDITVQGDDKNALPAVFGNYYRNEVSPSKSFVSPIGITVRNSTFSNNKVTKGWFGPFFISAIGDIDSSTQTHRIESTEFKNNSTIGYGGAIQTTIESAGNTISEIQIASSNFLKNHADKNGGAINLDNYIVTISKSVFKENTAGEGNTGNGGAISSNAHHLILTDSIFEDNVAVEKGGAIYLYAGSLRMNTGEKDQEGKYIYVTGQHRATKADINVISEDLTYTGNKVTGENGKGGFLYMADDSTANVNVAEGRTLTIGEAGVLDAKTDSIATDENSTARMVKHGAGTMVINSSMEDFNGAFDVTQGKVRIATLNMPGVLSADAEEGSAVVTIEKVAGDALDGTVNARRNGMVVIGSDEASVRAAMQKSGVTGEHGVIYVGRALDMSGGSLVVGEDPASGADGSVVAANGGVLMVDQTAGTAEKPIFSNASVIVDADSTLTLVNASVGTINLADRALTVNGNITTDNPFIEGSIVDGKLVSVLNAEDGLTSIASTGIQAMARRADFVMAQTIADRTAFDQERAQGVRLWVDVTGERYEADSLDNGGNFRADAGYAAFGGDVDVGSDWVVGAAMQYGTGSLRSDVSNIKNDITSYGLTGYASKKFGDWKVVGELAYLQSENEITSSQAALNVDVDAQVYSAGIRAQYELTAGSFAFIPSVGLRVSRLETDAFNVNTVRVDDQSQTLVQMPIALRITSADLNASGWSVAPNFKVAFVPTFGDKEIKMSGVEQTVIDTSPVQADFGILARKGNMTLNAGMLLGGGKDGTSSIGGKVGLSYAF